ncbi:hypothetical protein CDAR_42121 [Caerostris darwini]|uniref:Uncharacterized protein n=1 Tax=Caerostris darwini TaxID=1538125 RepID=A0AAV4RGF4_9ARAC|nr:hypothetical protein CDAR_42121 [Caerostris darwini]
MRCASSVPNGWPRTFTLHSSDHEINQRDLKKSLHVGGGSEEEEAELLAATSAEWLSQVRAVLLKERTKRRREREWGLARSFVMSTSLFNDWLSSELPFQDRCEKSFLRWKE